MSVNDKPMLVETIPPPLSALSRFDGPEGRQRAILALCEQRPILGNVAAAEALLDAGELCEYQPGEKLIVEGDWTNSIHFLLTGSVSVTVNGFVIVERASGLHVGETEVADPAKPRAATVTALELTVSLQVAETAFSEVAAEHRGIWRQITKVLADRLTERNRFIRGPNTVPRIFIGCSTEALPVARAFLRRLNSAQLIADIWNGGIFKPAEHALESLGQELNKADFALTIFSPDDFIESRGQTMLAPRDNTVYELGLFAGALGRRRSFYAVPRGVPLKLPSDLTGITALRYTWNPQARPRADCVEATTAVLERVVAMGPR